MELYLYMIATIAIVSFLGMLLCVRDIKRVEAETSILINKNTSEIEELFDRVGNAEECVSDLNSRLSIIEGEVDSIRSGWYNAEKQLNDHLAEHLKNSGTKVELTKEEKIGAQWSMDKKHECQDFMLKSKDKLSYNEMSAILRVPCSTLKRWAQELEV